MHRGYIKIWRKSIDGGWLSNAKLWLFWCYCLLRATHKPRKVMLGFKEINLEPGQFIFGRRQASKDTKLSEQTVRTSLHMLLTSHNIAIQTTNKYSIITILNWDTYQDDEKIMTHKTTNKRPTNDQQLTTNKHYKKEKNKKNISSVLAHGLVPDGTPEGEKPTGKIKVKTDKHPPCPYEQIIESYHKHMPGCPRIKVMDEQSKVRLRTRWREDPERQDLAWWDRLFAWCAESEFLTGKVKDFQADLLWIVRPMNWAKVANGNYHRGTKMGLVSERTRGNLAALDEFKKRFKGGNHERDGERPGGGDSGGVV